MFFAFLSSFRFGSTLFSALAGVVRQISTLEQENLGSSDSWLGAFLAPNTVTWEFLPPASNRTPTSSPFIHMKRSAVTQMVFLDITENQ